MVDVNQALRDRGLLNTLEAIDSLKLLESGEVAHLRDAYLFLRRLENLLQAMADKQTQTLPDNEQEQLQLAVAMQFESWQALIDETRQHMANVHVVFEELIGVMKRRKRIQSRVTSVSCGIWHISQM